MPFAEFFFRRMRLAVVVLALALAACGGGSSSVSTLVGAGVSSSTVGSVVTADQPQGPNTTEVVIDSGPSAGLVLGTANLPYVTVTVCAPGSASACVTIDHVFLDTGSIGLRVLRSAVSGIGLPLASVGAGTVVECYPFVVGAVWGPLATADVHIAGETARGLPVQLIDDGSPAVARPTADCQSAANGALLASVTALQANGVLGVGMLRYDCGLNCDQGNYAGGYTLYYSCDVTGACSPLAVPAAQQIQNPVSYFDVDNNGTVLVLPAVPDTGAAQAHGRLVFGIGTQANNQLPANATLLRVDPDPTSPSYLYFSTSSGGTSRPYSYVDSGSNGLFFYDATLSTHCSAGGAGGNWFCPTSPQLRSANLLDGFGNSATVNFSIISADVLFATSNTAFATLGGDAGAASPGTFVWGLPFFFGRQVYSSIWGQALATNGPWVAF
jgi:hypothetical protein